MTLSFPTLRSSDLSCAARSSEYSRHSLDAANQSLDILLAVIDPEARPRGGVDAEMRHQRLGAMMAGADRHLALIQYGADVVGMNPLDREADDPGRILRPEQADAFQGGE